MVAYHEGQHCWPGLLHGFPESLRKRPKVESRAQHPELPHRIADNRGRFQKPFENLSPNHSSDSHFARKTRTRKELEGNSQSKRDYKAELLVLFSDMDTNFPNAHKRYVAERYRNFFLQVSAIATQKDCQCIYEGLISGDPKLRTFRALYQRVYGRYIDEAKKSQNARSTVKNG